MARRRRPAGPLPWPSRTLTALLAGLVLSLGPTLPASADAALTDADPGPGVALTSPPARIELRFNEEALETGTRVLVEGPDGSVTSGGPEIDGTVVRQRLKTGLPDGTYTVSWRVVSSDGHPVNDTYTFTIRARAASATPAPTSSSPAPASPSPTAGTGSSAPNTATPAASPAHPADAGPDRTWWWVFGFAAVAAAAGLGWWLTRRPRRGP